MLKYIFVMGPTNVGKTTYINNLKNCHGVSNVETLLTGQILRKKYGEEYFKGQQAPEHTEDEVIERLRNFIIDNFKVENDNKICIIDGQPRSIRQLDMLYNLKLNGELLFNNSRCKCEIHYLYCSDEIRLKRLLSRDSNIDKLLLSLKRFSNDELELNNIMMKMYKIGIHPLVTSINTGLKD